MASILEAIFVTFVMAGMFFALSRAWYSPEVVVFLSLVLVWNVGILSDAEALSGFNNPSMLVIGGLFVAVAAIENSGLAEIAANRVLGLETTFSSGFLRLMICAVAGSAFVNNTPVAALLIPVTRDWARTRGFNSAALLMPLSFACIFGGMLTTVGGGTNLVIQGLLYEAGKSEEGIAPFRLFEPSWVGLPLVVVGVGYLLVAAPRLLAPGSGGGSSGGGGGDGGGGGGGAAAAEVCSGRDRSEDVTTEVEVGDDFELVGQPFALVLASLGLPMDSLMKVRRRFHSVGATARGGTPLAPMGIPDHDGSDRSGVGDGGDGDGAIDGFSHTESNGLSWAGRIETGVAALAGRPSLVNVGGIGLVALRKRPLCYQRLERGDSGEQSSRFADSEEACIEMPTMRTSRVGDAAVADGGGTPATEGASRASSGSAALGYSGGTSSVDEICDVSPKASVRPGDVLVLSCDRDAMVHAIGSVASRRKEGLKVLGTGAAKLPRHGTVLLELVLSRSSRHFLGRTARLDNAYFAAIYGCVVVAFRLKGSLGFGGGGSGGGDGRDRINSGNGRHSVDVDSPAIGKDRTGCEAMAEADADAATASAIATITAATATCGFDGIDTPLATSRDGSSASVGSPLQNPGVTPGKPLQYCPVISPPASVASPPLLAGGDSPFIGARPPENAELGARRRRGEALAPGDVVVVLATEDFLEEASSKREFLREERVGRLREPTGWFHYSPLLIFAAMLAWVLAIGVDMVRAVFAACAVLILGGWVDARRAVGHVNWGLLLLIGSALGFSKAVSNSGLAEYAAVAVQKSGMGASASVYVLFGFTMLCTELISNNAAAALNIPIALSMAREMEADYKPFAMAVLVAASSSFLTPIGTPTNALVWAPGGYKFYDYARVGAPLSILFWLVGCAVIPWLFPF